MGTDTDPSGRILQFVTDMTKISANVRGVDLGTDQDLTLAIQLDQGNTTAFDPTPEFKPDRDWLFSIDKSLLASFVSSNVSAQESQLDPSVVATTPVVTFTSGGITIDGGGSKKIDPCGTIPFTFEYTAIPTVCNRSGKSVFSLCISNTRHRRRTTGQGRRSVSEGFPFLAVCSLPAWRKL